MYMYLLPLLAGATATAAQVVPVVVPKMIDSCPAANAARAQWTAPHAFPLPHHDSNANGQAGRRMPRGAALP